MDSIMSFGYDKLSFSFIVLLVFEKLITRNKKQCLTMVHVSSNVKHTRIVDGILSKRFTCDLIFVDSLIAWLGLKIDEYIGYGK